MAEKSHTERAGQLFRALLAVECRAELSHLAHLGTPPAGVQAYGLLAPVYGWFTEGFDAPVLKEAKALLDELT